MIYLLKFLGSSIILYGIYYFLLRNEKTFKFNRFYLLTLLVLAAIIPLVIVKTTIVEIPYQEPLTRIISEEMSQIATSTLVKEEAPFQIDWSLIGKISYFVITLLLLMRFILNLRAIRNIRKTGEEITFKNLPLVKSPKVNTTFSFLSRVFVNKAQFKKEGLAHEILAHEHVHIQQKHSLDIIFMELVASFIWFNPVVYFIRRNIKLNHEYLADAGVLKHSKDPNAYQMLLLKHSRKELMLNPLLASHLSYGETKQRFKIMFKTTNKRVAALKQLTALALITGLFFAMGEERVIAQDQETASEQKVSFDLPSPPPPVKFRLTPKTKIRFEYANGDVVNGEYGKLSGRNKKIFESPEGKGEVWVQKVTHLKVVTTELLEKYSDATKFKVWIDKKLIDANSLKTHAPSDFSNYFISPIGENEKEYGTLTHKIDLWTRDYQQRREPKLPNGTWVPYDESMSPDFQVEAQNYQDIPPPPPPRIVSVNPRERTKVRFIDSRGEMVTTNYGELSEESKKRFASPEANGQIFLPPPPPAFLSDKMLEEFKNPEEYGVWIDGKRVENKVLSKYTPKDFHHFFKSRLLKNAKHYGQYTYHLSLETQDKWKTNPASNGTWLNYEKPARKKLPQKEDPLKQDEIPADYEWGQGPTKEQAALHDKEVLHFLTATADTRLKMTLPNGTILIKKAKNYTREEWYRWWDPAYEGMLFDPPIKAIEWDVLNEWRENPEKYTIMIDNEVVKNIDDLGSKRFAFSEISKTQDKEQIVIELTPKEKYLDAAYFDTAWRPNVIYK